MAHTPTPYQSKQMNRPRSSFSPIQYQLSSPHGETIVFDLFPPPFRFSDISKIEGILNYVPGSELTSKKPRNEKMQIMPSTLPDIGQVFRVVTFFFFFIIIFFLILRRMGRNKALAHHTSTYFHTRRVSNTEPRSITRAINAAYLRDNDTRIDRTPETPRKKQ